MKFALLDMQSPSHYEKLGTKERETEREERRAKAEVDMLDGLGIVFPTSCSNWASHMNHNMKPIGR